MMSVRTTYKRSTSPNHVDVLCTLLTTFSVRVGASQLKNLLGVDVHAIDSARSGSQTYNPQPISLPAYKGQSRPYPHRQISVQRWRFLHIAQSQFLVQGARLYSLHQGVSPWKLEHRIMRLLCGFQLQSSLALLSDTCSFPLCK